MMRQQSRDTTSHLIALCLLFGWFMSGLLCVGLAGFGFWVLLTWIRG